MHEPISFELCSLEDLGLQLCRGCGYVYLANGKNFYVVGKAFGLPIYGEWCKRCHPHRTCLEAKKNVVKSTEIDKRGQYKRKNSIMFI